MVERYRPHVRVSAPVSVSEAFSADRLLLETQTPPPGMTYRTRLVAHTRSAAKQLFPSPAPRCSAARRRLIIQHGDKARSADPGARRSPRSDNLGHSGDLGGVDSRGQWRPTRWLPIRHMRQRFCAFLLGILDGWLTSR